MLMPELLHDVVARARLAPSVHNIQPARWRMLGGDVIELTADPHRRLPAADPTGRDVALSCGAAAEATRLALSALGIGAEIEDIASPTPHLRLHLSGHVPPDPLHAHLEARVTCRGGFQPDPRPWRTPLATIIQTPSERDAILALQDQATARTLADTAQRRELLQWMRLTPWHPDRQRDGMAGPQLAMGWAMAGAAQLALGPLWPMVERLGLAGQIGDEAMNGRDAAAIALFCRPKGESPTQSGIAYLHLWLEATALGWAGWPMAAVADDPQTHKLVREMFHLPDQHNFLQALRFGPPLHLLPPHVRLPVAELILPAG